MTHHGFFIGATANNTADLQSVEGMEEFVASRSSWEATGDLLVHEQRHLEDIFANTGGVIATHAEDEKGFNPEFLNSPTGKTSHMLSAETLSARLSRQREPLHLLRITTIGST